MIVIAIVKLFMMSLRRNRWVATVLSVILGVALSGNAFAAVFCPMASGRACCMKASPAGGSAVSITMDHEHMHHQMSESEGMDMDMDHDSPMDMSQMSTEDTSERVSVPQATNFEDPQQSEAFTLPSQPCSHCMMHSQSNSNVSLRVASHSNSSDQVIALDLPTKTEPAVSPFQAIVELHEHGPPGLIAPLYVLTGSFRI